MEIFIGWFCFLIICVSMNNILASKVAAPPQSDLCDDLDEGITIEVFNERYAENYKPVEYSQMKFYKSGTKVKKLIILVTIELPTHNERGNHTYLQQNYAKLFTRAYITNPVKVNRLYGIGLAIKTLELAGSGMYVAYIPAINHLNCLTELIFRGYTGDMLKTCLPPSLASIKTLTSLTLNLHYENIRARAIGQLITNNVLRKITVASNELLKITVNLISKQKDRNKQNVQLKYRAHIFTWSFEKRELNIQLKFNARIDCKSFIHFQIEIIKISYNRNLATNSLEDWKELFLGIKNSVKIIRIRQLIHAYETNATCNKDPLFTLTSIVKELEKLEVLQFDFFVWNKDVPDDVFLTHIQQNMDTLISVTPRNCRMSIIIRPNDMNKIALHESLENTLSDEWTTETQNAIHFNYISSTGEVISWAFENKTLNTFSNSKAAMVPTAFIHFPIEIIQIAFEGEYALHRIEDCKKLLLNVKESVKVVKIVGLIRAYNGNEQDFLCTSTIKQLEKLENLYLGIIVSNHTVPNGELLSKMRQNTDTLLRISPANCKLTLIFMPSDESKTIIDINEQTLCGRHWSIFWLLNQHDIKCSADKTLISE